MARYLRHSLERHFLAASRQFPAALVTGSRQVGKTTLLRHVAERGRHYLPLDDPVLCEFANSDPRLLSSGGLDVRSGLRE